MPATPIPVVEGRTAYLYDGTNSADLAAAIDDFTVVSEDATTLTFTSAGAQLSVPRNGYVVAAQGRVTAENVFANEDDFRDVYTTLGEALAHKHKLELHTGVGYPAGEGDEGEEGAD